MQHLTCLTSRVCDDQWNLSIKDTLNKGHFSNEDTICSPKGIELCTNLPLNCGHLDGQLGPKGVLYI